MNLSVHKQHWLPLTSALAAALLILTSPPLPAAERIASPAEARLRTDVGFHADDAREGREPGTKGIEAAADYIARAFEQAGLKPAPGANGYFQPFSLGGKPASDWPLELAFGEPDGNTITAERGDFNPLAIGTNGSLAGVPIVFAGYGITAKDEPPAARLRRLRRPRRQRKSRPDHQARAASPQ